MIHPSIVRFATEWFTLEVSQQRFTVETKNPASYEMQRDLVAGIFTSLEHTPFHQLGINSSVHVRLPSVEHWHRFGHLLAPKAPWSGLLEEPGLRTIALQGKRGGPPSETIVLTVEPSVRVIPHGVFVNVNNHFQLTASGDSARELLETFTCEWVGAYAKRALEHLLAQVTEK